MKGIVEGFTFDQCNNRVLPKKPNKLQAMYDKMGKKYMGMRQTFLSAASLKQGKVDIVGSRGGEVLQAEKGGLKQPLLTQNKNVSV